MKRFVLTLLFLLSLGISFAQPLGPAFVVYFTDKDNSPYSIQNPSEFLTEAALDRRARQSITIEMDDIPVNATYLEAITNAGAQIAMVSRWFNLAGVWILNPDIIPVLQALPFVALVEPMGSGFKNLKAGNSHDKLSDPLNLYLPDGILDIKAMHSNHFNYGQGHQQINMINGIPLHNQGYRGQGMVIAVLDAGFRNVDIISAFDSLRANNRILGTRDFVNPGNNVYNPAAHTHGTHVLSIMAANLPGQMVGTAPEASYWLLRTEDHDPPALPEYLMEEYFWIAGAEFADSVGAWVINSSLGYYHFDDPAQNHTYEDLDGNTTPVTRGANHAASKGVLVVNSAGNEGNKAWYHIIVPADGPGVMAIGAVTADSSYVSWSSKGPTSDGRIKPDVSARGAGTWIVNVNGSVSQGSGTSFSSPIIAGMSACLWQSNKNVGRADVYQSIIQSSSQFMNPDNFRGFGIPNFEQAQLLLTSIADIASRRGVIKLYPNPATSFINIETWKSGDSIYRYTISDLTGRIIISRDFGNELQNQVTENIEMLRLGVYLLNVESGKGPETLKFIKL